MAVYKRYDQRRRRAVRNFCIWLAVILVIFAATALLGAYLGRRAETAPAPVGRFTAPGDIAALRESVMAFLADPPAPEEFLPLRERFSGEQMYERYNAIYREML